DPLLPDRHLVAGLAGSAPDQLRVQREPAHARDRGVPRRRLPGQAPAPRRDRAQGLGPAALEAKVRPSLAMARPDVGDREIELVTQVLRSDVLALGTFAPRFEAELAELAHRRFGISCSSGTAGLHLGVRALGIGRGDEVITTPFSFVASANCLLYEGAIPRFVDIEEDSLGLDPARIDAAASPRT